MRNLAGAGATAADPPAGAVAPPLGAPAPVEGTLVGAGAGAAAGTAHAIRSSVSAISTIAPRPDPDGRIDHPLHDALTHPELLLCADAVDLRLAVYVDRRGGGALDDVLIDARVLRQDGDYFRIGLLPRHVVADAPQVGVDHGYGQRLIARHLFGDHEPRVLIAGRGLRAVLPLDGQPEVGDLRRKRLGRAARVERAALERRQHVGRGQPHEVHVVQRHAVLP